MKDGSCKKMNPTERILDVLEYLSTAGLGPVKQVDMVRDLGLSPATLNRIVRILSERGYVFRTSEKYLVRNFTISRTIQMSASYMGALDEATRRPRRWAIHRSDRRMSQVHIVLPDGEKRFTFVKH